MGDDGGWEGFDLVKDIRRVVEPTSYGAVFVSPGFTFRVTYEIEVVRMPCQLKNLGGLSPPGDLVPSCRQSPGTSVNRECLYAAISPIVSHCAVIMCL